MRLMISCDSSLSSQQYGDIHNHTITRYDHIILSKLISKCERKLARLQNVALWIYDMVLILILQFYFLTHFNVITVFCLASCIHCSQQKRRLLWLSTNCLSGSELIAMNQISYISVTDWRGRKNMFSLINLGECSKVLFWVKSMEC